MSISPGGEHGIEYPRLGISTGTLNEGGRWQVFVWTGEIPTRAFGLDIETGAGVYVEREREIHVEEFRLIRLLHTLKIRRGWIAQIPASP